MPVDVSDPVIVIALVNGNDTVDMGVTVGARRVSLARDA